MRWLEYKWPHLLFAVFMLTWATTIVEAVLSDRIGTNECECECTRVANAHP